MFLSMHAAYDGGNAIGNEYINTQVRFEPGQNTSCVSAREVLNIPVEDDGDIHLNLIYDYSLVDGCLEFGNEYPTENVKVYNSTGTIVFIDNYGTYV